MSDFYRAEILFFDRDEDGDPTGNEKHDETTEWDLSGAKRWAETQVAEKLAQGCKGDVWATVERGRWVNDIAYGGRKWVQSNEGEAWEGSFKFTWEANH